MGGNNSVHFTFLVGCLPTSLFPGEFGVSGFTFDYNYLDESNIRQIVIDRSDFCVRTTGSRVFSLCSVYMYIDPPSQGATRNVVTKSLFLLSLVD